MLLIHYSWLSHIPVSLAYIYTNIITIDKYVHTKICTYIYVNRLTMTVECKFRMASLHRKKLIISEYLVILCYTLSSVVLTDQIVEESKKKIISLVNWFTCKTKFCVCVCVNTCSTDKVLKGPIAVHNIICAHA